MTILPEDFPGTSRFEVLRELGRGGMGIVYEVLDKTSNERVALKTLRALTPDSLLRFKQEFRVLLDIDHTNLIGLHELIADDEAGWFFTMELVEGPTFLEYVRQRSINPPTLDNPTIEVPSNPVQLSSSDPPRRRVGGVLNESALRDAMAQLVRGLMALHEAGKIHRDIKPSNVLIDRSDSNARVVILDFGLAASHARAPQIDDMSRMEAEPHTIVGTVDYMSPEQAAGHPLGPETDWYSVGVMLFEALTGDVPFTGGPIEVLFAKQKGEARPPISLAPEIPTDLNDLCADLLRFSPSARPSALEILERLGGRGGPERTTTASSASMKNFVGREAELDCLQHSFEETRLGQSGSVYVVGESGVGKSALVRRFLANVRAECADLILLTGRCYERESVPYKAIDSVIDALSNYLVKRPAAEVTALLPPHIELLAEVFPVLSRVPAVVEAPSAPYSIIDPIERRTRVFGALRELFTRLARRHPVLLVIDDLQWADDDSRALLAELVRTPEAPAFMLLATLRPADSQIDAPITDLPVPRERLDLDRLPYDQALALATQISRSVAPNLQLPLEQLVREANGHPLFLDELIRFSATRTGATSRPIHLEDALLARIEALDAEAKQLLLLIALAGRPIRQVTVSQASGLASSFAKLIGLLRTAHLIRTNGMRGTDRVETFHDRVRAAALVLVHPTARPELHRKLAVAFETSGNVDPEPQMQHWAEAGDLGRASRYARLAADQAEKALAFDRAARLYEQCLSFPTDGPQDRRDLLVALGHALSNAGRGGQAAGSYLEAAQMSERGPALDLRRRAAEGLLRSGRINEGTEVVRQVLAAVDMKLAPTPVRALAAVAYRRARLRLRGLSYRERDQSAIPPSELTRIDVCWSVGTGLALVDPVRAADFQAQNLLLSLNAGEPFRVARAMCVEAMFSSAGGTANHKRTTRILDEAKVLADKVNLAHLHGLQLMMGGVTDFLIGRYPTANEKLQQAEQIFLEQCTGVNWELASVQPFRLWSQYFLGQLREVVRRTPLLLAAAHQRGDLFTLTNLRTEFVSLVALIRDQVDTARETVHQAMKEWTNDGIHLEHFWEMHSLAQIDLYAGEAPAAYDRVHERWADLSRALIFRVEQARVEGLYLRGRSALAAAHADRARRTELLRIGLKDADKLLSERAEWAQPLGLLLKASAFSANGDSAKAAPLAEQAVQHFAAQGMELHRSVAMWRHGEILGGDAGALLVAEARAWLTSNDVSLPERLVSMLSAPVTA